MIPNTKKPPRAPAVAEVESTDEELLESDDGDVLAAVLKRGPQAASDRKRATIRRVGLPIDVPFRVRAKSLGVARLLKLSVAPFGFVWVVPEVFVLLPRELPAYRLFLGVTVGGDWFVFASAVDGYRSEVAAAELVSVAQSVTSWTSLSAQVAGTRVVVPCADLGTPAFPDLSLGELLDTAFEGRKVTDIEDDRLDSFLGRFAVKP